MYKYRVECNYGSRYFDNASKAIEYFNRKKARNLDVEIWLVFYCYIEQKKQFVAYQKLLCYSSTNMPKS